MIRINNVLKWNSLKIGLVLSGGGAKGAYEAGVIRALYDLDIADKVEVVSGTSIGALNLLTFPMNEKRLCENIWGEIGYKNIIEVKEAQDNIKDLILKNIDFKKLRKTADLYACAYSLSEMRPVYFHLNEMTDEEVIQAVLASSAIPYVFQPISVRGALYADGGVNDPVYSKANSDKTPVKPLESYKLDFIIVVYLSDKAMPNHNYVTNAEFIDIIPSKPLEIIKGSGTMDFTKDAIRGRIELGYCDTIRIVAPVIMSLLTNGR